jgi:hypothetical protein
MEILALLLISLAALFLMMLGAIWGMNLATERMIGQKHRLIEEIVNTGDIPAKWRRRNERTLAKVGADPGQRAVIERRTVQDYLRRLDGLVRYAQTTPLVDGEESRIMLLGKLERVRAQLRAGVPDTDRS